LVPQIGTDELLAAKIRDIYKRTCHLKKMLFLLERQRGNGNEGRSTGGVNKVKSNAREIETVSEQSV
jgi:hypothetical protein